jgi:peptidoglycan/LPS O-acetylase OafA/YrhL
VKYYPAFDYLRIVLALVVVAAPGHADLLSWYYSGYYAVQVFFALSGWLIGGILIRSEPHDLPRFYFNRAARIWIPYLTAIGLLVVASLLKAGSFGKWLEPFFFDATFTYNAWDILRLDSVRHLLPLGATGDHFWSICAEEQFYLFAPCLITLMPYKIGRSMWFWAFLSTFSLGSIGWQNFGAISLGVLAAVSRASFGDWHLRVRWPLSVAAIIGFMLTYLGVVPLRLAAPVSAILIVLSLAVPGEESKVGSFVGGISYPLYLNHWIGIFSAAALFGHTIIGRLAGLPCAVIVAIILYVAIDQNVRRYRSALFTIRRGLITAAIGFLLLTSGLISLMIITGEP